MCCPECGSLRVYYRGKSAPESSLVFWECEDCKKRWKGSAKKMGRAVVIE